MLPGEAVAELRQIRIIITIIFITLVNGGWVNEDGGIAETDSCKTLTVKADQVFKCPLATSL